jgi:RNase H-fold protein (predicted Holliday junction resolvase)
MEADSILSFLGEKNAIGKKDELSAMLILESYRKKIKNEL